MGNSTGSACTGSLSAVHPHVHGELAQAYRVAAPSYGSSPRAWGTPDVPEGAFRRVRFIPTCMGNSSLGSGGTLRTTVHPHVHGELASSRSTWASFIGSSPRAWGTPLVVQLDFEIGRFIPTCMGNSGSLTTPRRVLPVHPHVHGELGRARTSTTRMSGSSPRAWGTREYRGSRLRYARFIPTCMGNSLPANPIGSDTPVHPHVHGELAKALILEIFWDGSSPRAWGTRRGRMSETLVGRFIPTCMGNSGARWSSGRRWPVHPHVHGELESGGDDDALGAGSSPRAWGTRGADRELSLAIRFIPTCMGNS